MKNLLCFILLLALSLTACAKEEAPENDQEEAYSAYMSPTADLDAWGVIALEQDKAAKTATLTGLFFDLPELEEGQVYEGLLTLNEIPKEIKTGPILQEEDGSWGLDHRLDTIQNPGSASFSIQLGEEQIMAGYFSNSNQ